MTSDNSPNEFVHLWQAHSATSFQMSPDEIRGKMKRLNRKLLSRDLTIYMICIGETVWFLRCFFVIPDLIAKLGSLLVVIAMAYLAWQIAFDRRRRRTSRERADASGNINSLDFYRMELSRQRDFHRGVWFWSRAAVLAPGIFVFSIGAIVTFPKAAIGYVLTFGSIILFAIAIWINRKMSANYQRQIDALESLRQCPMP
jgi:hypothetical protein